MKSWSSSIVRYASLKWTCRKKDIYGVKECASHDIKDEVVTRLLIESYNESIDANNEVNGVTEQEEKLRKLIANEQELRQLRAKGYISEGRLYSQECSRSFFRCLSLLESYAPYRTKILFVQSFRFWKRKNGERNKSRPRSTKEQQKG